MAATNFPGYYIGDTGLPFYVQEEPVTLQTIGYYFARPGVAPQPGFFGGRYDFSTWSATPSLLFGSVGQPLLIAGYAQHAIANYYSSGSSFAYVGQYFTNAFAMTNGVVTTTSAGLLSEYGEFLPMMPGHVALLTKPDRRKVQLPTRYVGFEIPDRFVIGYGLDHDERHRSLPFVAVLDH